MSQATPTVSVVIAAYNYGRFLAGALQSVLAQTFGDYEVTVIDDGSTDDTRSIVQSYLGDRRIHYARTSHVGQPAAKNEGIRRSRGRLIAFLDADDLWLPTKLEKQVALFRDDPRVGVVYCRRVWIDEQGRDLDTRERPVYRGDVLAQVFRQSFVCFSSSMVRRAVFEDVGLFDESIPLSIDYDLWLRIALKYRFDYVDEPLTRYRTGHANLSRRQEERLFCVRRIIDRFLDELGGREKVAPALVRLTLADYYSDLAFVAGRRSRIVSLGWYLRALTLRPYHATAWRGLATSWWPEAFRSRLRAVLGRPVGSVPQSRSLQASFTAAPAPPPSISARSE